MTRIEERLEVFRQSGYAGCGEMLTNAFMFSVIESCKMSKRVVEDYLMLLLDKLKKAHSGT